MRAAEWRRRPGAPREIYLPASLGSLPFRTVTTMVRLVIPGLVTTTVIAAPGCSLRRISVFMLTLSDFATAVNAFLAQPPPLQDALTFAPAGTFRTSSDVNVVVVAVRVNA